MKHTVGSVPYLNAKPLVKPLEWIGERSPVTVLYDVPSHLPAMLEAGKAEAILVSSYFTLVRPGLRIADGLSISTQNDVLSVRLFSKVPPSKIRTLALDESSMTSNAVAHIVLRERYHASPVVTSALPDMSSMLSRHDACVLIGDNGMRADGMGLYELDLGAEWRALTGLPFVWAVWAGNEALSPMLVGRLQEALRESLSDIERVLREASVETGFTPGQCAHYLLNIMDYRLDHEHLEGLAEFGKRIERHGLAERTWMPALVRAPSREPANI